MSSLGTRLILYETGNMKDPEIVELFQDLIDIGVVWDDTKYSILAKSLVIAGLCHRPKKVA